MEYLYDDGEFFYFMNTETFDQLHLTKELLGDAVQYLVPQLQVSVEFYEGKPMSVELPATVDLTVVETEPGLRGASVSNVTKAAKLETGLIVQVPPFINEGEKNGAHRAMSAVRAIFPRISPADRIPDSQGRRRTDGASWAAGGSVLQAVPRSFLFPARIPLARPAVPGSDRGAATVSPYLADHNRLSLAP